ncbi:MAG TPA: TenA family protein, partial [Dermatophilaceae bacterium]|nr:TenA family protein [Dermatophilaceae bacterium]
MSFSQDAWEAVAPIRKAIDELPFLTGMEDGTLPRDSFVYYMAQDALYLSDYGRVLAAAASQSADAAELLFWAQSACTVVTVERELHAAHVADFAAIPRSPTCMAYTSYLFSLAAAGCYPALAAGILPCFWIYEDVGNRLKNRLGDLTGHPYADWISTYGDPEFAAATEQ